MIISPVTDWHCPACGKTTQTRTNGRHAVVHQCPKLAGITVPYVRDGIKAKVEAKPREDYVGREVVTTDENGVAVMSIVTTRDDGQDTAVFAPAARVGVEGNP